MNADTYYKNVLLSSFKNFWEEAVLLEDNSEHTELNTFINEFVLEEYRGKFKKTFNSYKKVSQRFFIKSREVKKDFKFQVDASVEVLVFLYSISKPVIFSLTGQLSTIGKIFLSDEDSVAVIKYPDKKSFFFLNTHNDEIYEVMGE